MNDKATIAVVGAGVIGLTTAIRLRETGRNVEVFAARRTPDITSNRAGAIFSPFRIEGHAGAAEWTRESFDVFDRLARERPESGVSMGAMREYFFTALPCDPWWKPLVREFQRLENVPSPYADAIRAVMPKMDIPRYLPWLEQQFTRELGGVIRSRDVHSLDEVFSLGFQTVVNCSGIGARELANDSAVTPYRGQILRVKNTMGLTECLLEESREEIGSYVFAFDDYLVLGGTFEKCVSTETPEATAIEAIVERCRALLRAGGIENVSRLADERLIALAGLRPCRDVGTLHEAVRLGREVRPDGRVVIHNYGHGRAGITLSWGCASDVVKLA